LRGAGYATLAVSGNFVHVTEAAGMARGFERFRTVSRPAEDAGRALWTGGEHDRRAMDGDEINRAVRRLLASHTARPVFLYVHYMEPHSPYTPDEAARRRLATDPSGWADAPIATNDDVVDLARRRPALAPAARQRLVDLYDAEIAGVDAAVGALVDDLIATLLGPETVVVIASDHGEELGDHGGWFHGLTLYRESVAVPLLLLDARHPERAGRDDSPVDLLDVPTTLLAAAGVAPAPGMRGRVLGAPGGLAERGLVAELHADAAFEAHVAGRVHALALTRWPRRVLLRESASDGPLLCRLDRDPAEADCREEPAADFAPLAAEAQSLRAARPDAGTRGTAPLDAETRARLRALGYAD
jgi:arylsulfatase A-like enzyme